MIKMPDSVEFKFLCGTIDKIEDKLNEWIKEYDLSILHVSADTESAVVFMVLTRQKKSSVQKVYCSKCKEYSYYINPNSIDRCKNCGFALSERTSS